MWNCLGLIKRNTGSAPSRWVPADTVPVRALWVPSASAYWWAARVQVGSWALAHMADMQNKFWLVALVTVASGKVRCEQEVKELLVLLIRDKQRLVGQGSWFIGADKQVAELHSLLLSKCFSHWPISHLISYLKLRSVEALVFLRRCEGKGEGWVTDCCSLLSLNPQIHVVISSAGWPVLTG